MATNSEVNQSFLNKIISQVPTADVMQLIELSQGAESLTQMQISPSDLALQKVAKQAILDRAKQLADATTDTGTLGLLIGAMTNYTVKKLDGGVFSAVDLTAPMGGINYQNADSWSPIGHGIPLIQSQRKRVIAAGNPMWGGTILDRELDPTNTSKFKDGTDATPFVAGGALDGSLSTYQVYVQEPKFYYVQKQVGDLAYYAIGLAPFEIILGAGITLKSSTHPQFRKTGWTDSGNGTDSLNERDFAYKSAFEAILFDNDAVGQKTVSDGNLQTNGITVDYANDKLISVANLSLYLQPCTYITRANARTLIAKATSKQWHWDTYSATRLLYLCEYLNHNSQATIGGYTEGSGFSYAKVAPTGTTLSLGDKTGAILNNGAVIPAIAGVSSSAVIGMSYRGEENIFGNIWKWCDGVNISNQVPYTCEIDAAYSDDLFSGVYSQAGSKQPTTNAYQAKVQDGSFFVKSVGSSSAKDITDYYYQSAGNCVVVLGGSLNLGSIAGLASLSAGDASSDVSANIGAR